MWNTIINSLIKKLIAQLDGGALTKTKSNREAINTMWIASYLLEKTDMTLR